MGGWVVREVELGFERERLEREVRLLRGCAFRGRIGFRRRVGG